jgi:hypothetical protein
MALRADWSRGEENFALSVGGFHPRFNQVPAGFPTLSRLMVKIGTDNPRLTLSVYLAITANTLQIGARLGLWAKKLGFTITGGASFDALFTFSPFSFLVIINVWVRIKRSFIDLGVWLELELSGPNPIVAAGYAKFKIAFFTKKVRFRAEFGDRISEPLPVISPLAVLSGELQHPRSIRSRLPAWATANFVFTRTAEERIDPIADLMIIQNAVPLNVTLERFGGGIPPAAEQRLSVTAGFGPALEQSVQRPFAPEQFKNWTVDERLSARPFENLDAGISLNGQYVVPESYLRERPIAFETVLRESRAYREQLPRNDYRAAFLRTTCVWQLGSDHEAVRADWSLFGSQRYFRPLRGTRSAAKSDSVTLAEATFGLASPDVDVVDADSN